MSRCCSLLAFALLVVGACAAESDDLEDSNAEVTAHTNQAAICTTCPGDGDGDGDNSAPAISLGYDASTRKVTVFLSHMPDGVVRISRQLNMDWTCNLKPPALPSASIEVGSVTARNGTATFTDPNLVADNCTFFYFAQFKNRAGAQDEIHLSVDTKIVGERGAHFTGAVIDSYSVKLTWIDGYITEDLYMVERNSGDGWSEIARRQGAYELSCKDFLVTDSVSPGSTHCYRLRVHTATSNTAGNGFCLTTPAQ